MENSNSKAITVSFMLTAVLLGIVTKVLLDTIAAIATGAVGRFVSDDLVQHGLPVVVGLGAFIGLQFSKPVVAWADEVVTEISRVVWPSRKDTVAMTIVVCVMVLASGAYFGILDVLSGAVVDWLLHQNFFGIFG